jgi:anti-sigma B factor antagonist
LLQIYSDEPDGGFMEITTKQFKHCDLVSIKGRVDSATSPKLNDAIEDIFEDGRYKIVIDLSETEYMSSAGFRVIVATQKNCKRFNRGEVCLAGVPKMIRESLDLTGMTILFKIFDDATTAVGSF